MIDNLNGIASSVVARWTPEFNDRPSPDDYSITNEGWSPSAQAEWLVLRVAEQSGIVSIVESDTEKETSIDLTDQQIADITEALRSISPIPGGRMGEIVRFIIDNNIST